MDLRGVLRREGFEREILYIIKNYYYIRESAEL
jgi:hypothetical protein